jgi:hypothetical protein
VSVPARHGAGTVTSVAPDPPRFEPVLLADRLTVVAPHGDVGVVTLWTPVAALQAKLGREAPALLDPAASRIAVVANLYGDGLQAMLCNLLHNPQVRHLVVLGQDLGLGVPERLEAFLRHGTEPAELAGRAMRRIVGTSALLRALPGFDERRLREQVALHRLGRLGDPGFTADLSGLLAGLPTAPEGPLPARVRVVPPPPEAVRRRRPADAGAHRVRRRSPLACWAELAVRCLRFGVEHDLGNGPRLELRNVLTTIAEPRRDDPEALRRHGFDPRDLARYERAILDPELPETVDYAYGHRLRGHFPLGGAGTDALEAVAAELRRSPASRRAYAALWDTAADLGGTAAAPCLTTVAFRATGGRLELTATFRAHNLLEAWLGNAHGLLALAEHVAARVEVPVGPLTILSHSLGLDPASDRAAVAEELERAWRTDDDVDPATGRVALREDGAGHFVVSVDREAGEVVADHVADGVPLKRYRAARAATITAQVAADMAVTDVGHALWLGRELQRHEALLRAG